MDPVFRTIERSSPRFEHEGLGFIAVKSKYLKGRGDICVFVPPGLRAGPTPVVVLLHGVYGSAWSWALNGGVHRTAMQMITEGRIPPMILAMPSDGLWGDGSAYLPHNGLDFEKWIAGELPLVMQHCFEEVHPEGPFFIGGLSMGGYGALRIGVKYSGKFSAVSVHSSITALEQMKIFVEEDLSHYRQSDAVEEDVFMLMLRHRGSLPAIRMDCGTEDELIGYNRKLHEQMTGEGIAHVYEEFRGGHHWSYWETHVRNSLLFFSARLRP